jgi:type II secretory pathway pseudopilin PulG
MIAMVVLIVALSIFSGIVVSTSRQRIVNRETAIATEAARVVLEAMREAELAQVFALYDPDPLNDPEGVGTAPGYRFAVDALDPLPEAADGLVGEVRFPVVDVGTVDDPLWQLREDVLDARLGMPRDLSGDLVIDDDDHALDYDRLPVEIRLDWVGETGRRTISIHTMVCEFDYGS